MWYNVDMLGKLKLESIIRRFKKHGYACMLCLPDHYTIWKFGCRDKVVRIRVCLNERDAVKIEVLVKDKVIPVSNFKQAIEVYLKHI